MTTDPTQYNYYFECERWWKERQGILYQTQYGDAHWWDFDWRDLVVAQQHYERQCEFYARNQYWPVPPAVDPPSSEWGRAEQALFIISKWSAYCDTKHTETDQS